MQLIVISTQSVVETHKDILTIKVAKSWNGKEMKQGNIKKYKR